VRTVELLARTRALPRRPAPDELFDPQFLPPLADRVRSLADT
jgi:hypothetical protein